MGGVLSLCRDAINVLVPQQLFYSVAQVKTAELDKNLWIQIVDVPWPKPYLSLDLNLCAFLKKML